MGEIVLRKGIFVLTDARADKYVYRMLSDIDKYISDLVIVIRKPEDEEQVLPEFPGKHVIVREGSLIDLYAEGAREMFGCDVETEPDVSAVPDGGVVFFSDQFFPFRGFDEIFEKAEKELSDCDVWSISCKMDPNIANGKNKNDFSFFIHSFFFCVNKETIPLITMLSDVHGDPDGALTVYLSQNERKVSVLWHTDSNGSDDTVFGAAELLENGFPIINKTIFSGKYDDIISKRFGSVAEEVINYVKKHTDGYEELIAENVIRVCSPLKMTSLLGAHYILPDGGKAEKRDAVFVFHAYYEEIFDEALKLLDGVGQAADIIITTTSEDRVETLTEKCSHYEGLKNAKVLLSVGNGRDIAGLLCEARPYLSGYKYVGFAHDKLTVHYLKYTGESFRHIMYDNMMSSAGYVARVIDLFETHDRLGVLVPPTPHHATYYSSIGRKWMDNFESYTVLCDKIGIDPGKDHRYSCLALGSCFWAKYDALRQLFEYEWDHYDFPGEPLPLNGSISHAIERSYPFIARINGYYSGYIYNTEYAQQYLTDYKYMIVDQMELFERVVRQEATTYASYKAKLTQRLCPKSENVKVSAKKQKEKINERKYLINIIKHSSFFNKKYYLDTYPDVKNSDLTPEEHYLLEGWKLGYDPSNKFSTKEYLQLNPGVARARMCPLIHYERYGKNEGRRLHFDEGDYRPMTEKRDALRAAGIKAHADLINKNKGTRILVVLHLFYMVAWKEIKEYLKNLDVYGYDLIVSYTNSIVDENVLEDIRQYKPDVQLLQFENLGYDVGAYTEILSDIDLDKYDIIFKLQSKGVYRRKIFIYGEYMERRDWFLNLFEGCIGPDNVHITIDKLKNDDQVGLVAADNLIVEDPIHKKNMVNRFLEEKGFEVPETYHFVAGTCFAAKACTMKPIKDMGLKVRDYQCAGSEFTLAHKMERVVCIVVELLGYKFYGNVVMEDIRAQRRKSPEYLKMKKYSGIRLLDDKRFKLDDEFVFFSLEHRLIEDYELVNIRLGDIRRRWGKTVISLRECLPYRYLVSGDPAVYEEYKRQNKAMYKLDIMSRERFDELMKSIDEKGFENENVIVVNHQNIILDGQHRCCYMLYKYGEDYEIPCLRIKELGKSEAKDKLADFLHRHMTQTQYNRLLAVYKKLRK